MTVEFYPPPETSHSQPKGGLSLLLTFKASWTGDGFWVTLLFARSRFPRQLKPAGRLLELWMGLGSVPVAFQCRVVPFLAGSWSTQRATREIPLSTSFLWSLVCAALKAMGPSKLFTMEGMELRLNLRVLAKLGCRAHEWLGGVTLQRRRCSGGCWCALHLTPKAGLERPEISHDKRSLEQFLFWQLYLF